MVLLRSVAANNCLTIISQVHQTIAANNIRDECSHLFMNKKQLAIFLSKLAVFDDPDAAKEQYPTDSEIAADLLWHIHMHGGLQDRTVADLGSGTGILGLGALLLGARKVYFVDEDEKTFDLLEQNADYAQNQLGIELRDAIKMVKKDVEALSHDDFEEKLDVVIQNPPFGTREEHADTLFLEAAMRLAPHIYSFHKSSTIDYIMRKLTEGGFIVKMVLNYQFPLKRTMAHHQKKIERIDVFCVDAIRQDKK